MSRRVAMWCFKRRRTVVLLWILGIVLVGSVMGAVGSSYSSDFTLPDVESKRGIDILDSEFGGQGAGQVANIVFQAQQGVDDPEVRESMEAFLADVTELDGVQSLTSPYEAGNDEQISQLGDQAGHIAYAEVEASSNASFDETAEIGRQIREAMPVVDGVRIELGGSAFAEFEVRRRRRSASDSPSSS